MPIKKYEKKLDGYKVKNVWCLTFIIMAIKKNANTTEQNIETLLSFNNLIDKRIS